MVNILPKSFEDVLPNSPRFSSSKDVRVLLQIRKPYTSKRKLSWNPKPVRETWTSRHTFLNLECSHCKILAHQQTLKNRHVSLLSSPL
jgi:ribosomal protein L44E